MAKMPECEVVGVLRMMNAVDYLTVACYFYIVVQIVYNKAGKLNQHDK